VSVMQRALINSNIVAGRCEGLLTTLPSERPPEDDYWGIYDMNDNPYQACRTYATYADDDEINQNCTDFLHHTDAMRGAGFFVLFFRARPEDEDADDRTDGPCHYIAGIMFKGSWRLLDGANRPRIATTHRTDARQMLFTAEGRDLINNWANTMFGNLELHESFFMMMPRMITSRHKALREQIANGEEYFQDGSLVRLDETETTNNLPQTIQPRLQMGYKTYIFPTDGEPEAPVNEIGVQATESTRLTLSNNVQSEDCLRKD